MSKNLCYHSHTFFCDGLEAPENYLIKAVSMGFSDYGFSGHAPLKKDYKWSMKMEDLHAYSKQIDDLKAKYQSSIHVYKALEIDYTPGLSYPFEYFKKEIGLDYTIGSVHLVDNPENDGIWFLDGPVEGFDRGLEKVFGGDIRKGVERFFHNSIEMLETQKPDIIGHMDKIVMNNQNRFFTTDDDWYLELFEELLQAIKKFGTIIEINTRGIYKKKYMDTYPGTYALKRILELQIPIVIGSDAHHPDDINNEYQECKQKLLQHGFIQQMRFMGKDWEKTPL